MSRSYHKMCSTKGIFCNWVCYKSNKKDKQVANRKIRKQVRQKLIHYDEYTLLLQHPREVSDEWNFNSDGLKHYRRIRQIGKDKYVIDRCYKPIIWSKKELIKNFFRK